MSSVYLLMPAVNLYKFGVRVFITKLGPSLKNCLFAVPLPCIFWLGR